MKFTLVKDGKSKGSMYIPQTADQEALERKEMGALDHPMVIGVYRYVCDGRVAVYYCHKGDNLGAYGNYGPIDVHVLEDEMSLN